MRASLSEYRIMRYHAKSQAAAVQSEPETKDNSAINSIVDSSQDENSSGYEIIPHALVMKIVTKRHRWRNSVERLEKSTSLIVAQDQDHGLVMKILAVRLGPVCGTGDELYR